MKRRKRPADEGDTPAFATDLRSSRRLREHPTWHLIDSSLAAVHGADVDRLLADLEFTGLLGP